MSSRRSFLQSVGGAAATIYGQSQHTDKHTAPLQEFGYGDVELASGPAQHQFEQTQSVLLSLDEDSLLKPWRLRAGLQALGPDLGGWYDEVPLDKTESGGHGFAPAHSFGQWISALARGYAIRRDSATRKKLEKLLALYTPTISDRFYKNFRFPAYNYDKMVIGLSDAQFFGGLADAKNLLERTTDAAIRHLPLQALDRDEPQRRWRESVGDATTNDYTWDESYTLPENLYLAWQRGAGEHYRKLARRFLLNTTYFDPLARNQNVLPNHHAYSFCNALSSAMQAYMADGSKKHFDAGRNAFRMIQETQSFATGGWGPNESFVTPGSDKLFASLTNTHRGFETPCGSYAHFKLARYLLRITGNGQYGDSMERVFYNTVLGAKPLHSNGSAFYYSDYHFSGRKSYFPDAWPCCSGTLPQVTADYRLLLYFRDLQGVFVNLYLPSTLHATAPDGVQFTLTQTGDYPVGEKISIQVRCSRSSGFALRLRIPAWSSAKTQSIIKVNGLHFPTPILNGFAVITRRWQDDDRIELQLTSPLRLEPIDNDHPETVALLKGPLVLFALGEQVRGITRQQLLSATPSSSKGVWRADTAAGPLQLCPFSAIEDQAYNTYIETSA